VPCISSFMGCIMRAIAGGVLPAGMDMACAVELRAGWPRR
jgi:hypothetical protein